VARRCSSWNLRVLLAGLSAIGLTLGIVSSLARRAERFEQLARLSSVQANRWENQLIGPSGTSRDGPGADEAARILQRIHQHDELADRFRAAARQPWREPEAELERLGGGLDR
jgi:hypothetical protein